MELHKDGISFGINETLYFENGQEIEEMLGVSLDPDITLQMYENYVQIRGIILLQGEYRKNQKDLIGQIERDENTNFIEKIIDKDKLEAVFTHRFPLDVSIPDERINKLEDVSVVVEEFDYELPDIHTLKVNASILIHGLKEDSAYMSQPEQETPFEEPEAVEEVLEEEKTEPEEVQEEIEIIDALPTEESNVEQNHDIDIQYKETEEEDAGEEVKDVQFLTELFGGEAEESYTKIKLYITQVDDTIESIAKHYQIPALQLMKDNNLTGEGIEEGQLLHISVKK